jgi:hypothetical protein
VVRFRVMKAWQSMARRDYHDSDYICPKRAHRKPVTTYLEPDTAKRVNQTAAQLGVTRQDALEQLCEGFANPPTDAAAKQPVVLWLNAKDIASTAAGPNNNGCPPVVLALDPELVQTARDICERRHTTLEETINYFLRGEVARKPRHG